MFALKNYRQGCFDLCKNNELFGNAHFSLLIFRGGSENYYTLVNHKKENHVNFYLLHSVFSWTWCSG